MEPSSIPLELISYRGLLKSFEDIVRGNFMNRQNNAEDDKKEEKNVFKAIKNLFVFTVFLVMGSIENSLFKLMFFFDNFVFKPLKLTLFPIAKATPRHISFRNFKTTLNINSNIVTLMRTMFIIPIIWFLKYNYTSSACFTVILHAFFGLFDGIYARIDSMVSPNQDDTLFKRFFIAFCNKIVNLLTLIAILQTVDVSNCEFIETAVYLAIIYTLIAYDVITAAIRVQNYFDATIVKDRSNMAIRATLEWKLKTKLESVGIAALCLASNKSYEDPVLNGWGIFGLTFLILTIRMAHKTLEAEVMSLKESEKQRLGNSKSADNLTKLVNKKKNDDLILNEDMQPKKVKRSVSLAPIQETETESNPSSNSLIGLIEERSEEIPKVTFHNDDDEDDEEDENQNEEIATRTRQRIEYFEKNPLQLVRQMSVPTIRTDNRVDKVYTIGCFDLFHHGHVRLIERMREVGKKVIIGVHDSRSIYKLKNRVPVDSTEKRMLNVKQYADEVFCIASTDPSSYMKSIVCLNDNESAVYIRGDDMPNFPAREVVEKLMPIKLLPYTLGVSSTQIRKEKFSHIKPDDEDYLEQNN